MKFTPIKNMTLSYSNCSVCEANCCDGRKGSVFSQIVLDEFESIAKNFPILFIFGELGFIKPIVLLTNGKTLCSYNKDFKCTIYETRPNVCKNYPLSPEIDNQIYIDLSCPALCEVGEKNIIKNGIVSEGFDNSSLENYQTRFLDTYDLFKVYENDMKNFELAFSVHGINFYKFMKESDDYYIQLHKKSLVHLENEYYKY